MASPSASPAPTSAANSSSTAPPDASSTDLNNQGFSSADIKRQHRAAKKAEQDARKAERKRIALETGIDPALLPKALAGEFALDGKDFRPQGFTQREWVEVPSQNGGDGGQGGKRVKILSWNMLAQALVRRELFPGSDFLKGKDRLPPLMQEVLYYSPDIACLQEVDRLSDHLPSLTLTHGYTSFIGYRNKAHGLLIAHKNSVFNKVGERGIRLDDQPIDDTVPVSAAPSRVATPAPTEGSAPASGTATPAPEQNGAKLEGDKPAEERPPDAPSDDTKASRRAVGITRSTRNVGLFVALEFKDQPGKGVIVGTTHLFWAGEYVYERTRQTGILMREARRFRDEAGEGKFKDWPVFLAGDFNTQPLELTYRLAVSPSATIPDSLLSEFERSRVVHHSVEKLYNPDFVPPSPPEAEAKEGEEAASASASTAPADPSPYASDALEDPTAPHHGKPIKNSRPGTVDEDGIVGLDALRALYAAGGDAGARSAYGEAYGLCPSQEGKWYCDRKPEVQAGNGWREQESEEEKAKRREGTWDERVKRGDFEPLYSNFTPLWRCTLDYIFLLPPSSPSAAPAPQWRSLLQMHDFHNVCEPGLPRKGVEPSDHVAIGAEVEIF
ncbi:hypothetical protein JCM10207_007637 [Rhodosporidiobolus poonsookiae]